MALPKWTDERTSALESFVGNESPVSQATVANAAEELETSVRSVSSKLRKMGYDVELASSSNTKSFSDEQEATLANFVQDNSGSYTYAEIAANFEGGAFSAKSIQGKILSMQLTEHVKPAPKVESVKTYSEDEEATFIGMVNDGAFIEQIAESLGRSVNSIRGKALSLLRAGEINAIPKQAETKGSGKADPLADLDIDEMTVEQIADEIGKTVRGVKTMLTRRGLVCADYDGSARKERVQS
jgi:transposase